MAFNPSKCLKFTCSDSEVTISLNISKIDDSHYQFSKNGTDWVQDTITLQPGESAYCKGTQYPTKELTAGNGFIMSGEGSIDIDGNIMSLVDDGAGELKQITQDFGFYSLFSECVNIKSIPRGLLPATTLSQGCYHSMFRRCTGITTIPEYFLPARTLTQQCYRALFMNCTGITSVPIGVLSADTLAKSCFDYMFCSCTSLEEIYFNIKSWTAGSSMTSMQWVQDAAPEGVFYRAKELPERIGVNWIPDNWTIKVIPTPTIYFQPEKL